MSESWSTREPERIVKIGATWIRPTAVDAVERQQDGIHVYLRGGSSVRVTGSHGTLQDVIDRLWKSES